MWKLQWILEWMQIAFMVCYCYKIIDIVWLDVSNVIFHTISNVLLRNEFQTVLWGKQHTKTFMHISVDDKMWFEQKILNKFVKNVD